jgi:ABC-type sugar transport system ATPase subunit
MQRTPALLFAASMSPRFHTSRTLYSKAIIQINNGTFYRQHPSSKSGPGQNAFPNPPFFSDLSFSLPSISSPNEHWAILSPSFTLRTAFLQILRGQYICLPPTARSYPYLVSDEVISEREKSGKRGSRSPENAVQYVGFDVERRAMGGQYLSARYESRVESTDFTLGHYLTGIVGMNPGEEMLKERTPDEHIMRQVVKDLELERFFDKPVSTLSNGQSRRARIGKALLTRPEVLCLDAPFSKCHTSFNG